METALGTKGRRHFKFFSSLKSKRATKRGLFPRAFKFFLRLKTLLLGRPGPLQVIKKFEIKPSNPPSTALGVFKLKKNLKRRPALDQPAPSEQTTMLSGSLGCPRSTRTPEANGPQEPTTQPWRGEVQATENCDGGAVPLRGLRAGGVICDVRRKGKVQATEDCEGGAVPLRGLRAGGVIDDV
jgi:hypothetical protein